MDSAQLKLGNLIDKHQQRDAVHVAVAPVRVCGEGFAPGDHVGINERGEADKNASHIGVLDPFLKCNPSWGDWCWLFLYPGSIHSVRHHWTHPVLDSDGNSEKERAIVRLREIAAATDIGYDHMMKAAGDWVHWGDYTTQMGYESWRDNFPTFVNEFWPLYEIVTGTTVPPEKRESFFSCSC